MNGARAILPGSTIGVLGGGPRARMLAQAAARLGYRVHVYTPQADSPAGQIAHQEVTAAYDDAAALAAFARECDVVTCEFAHVPVASWQEIESLTQLHPHWSVLETCQNRARTKNWLKQGGFPPARFAEVAAGGDIVAGIREVGLPCVVKTGGSEDEGPVQVREEAEVAGAERAVAGRACVIEQWIDLACEVTVVMARTARAAIRVFPLAENLRTNHRLEFSIVPARVAPAVTAAAEKMARLIAEKIGLVGVMGVELFVTRDGRVFVHELAPHTPESGHYTIDACATSQYEQQVRAICGLPLGDPRLISPIVMVSIPGEAWSKGEPKWDVLLAEPSVRLHLYGQAEPRPGRQMGHFTVTSRDADMALGLAQKIKARLTG